MTFWIGIVVGAILGAAVAVLGLGLCAAGKGAR